MNSEPKQKESMDVRGSLEWMPVEGKHCTNQPLGRQGSALTVCSGSLWLFGGRLEGRGREYGNDLWRRSLGAGQLWTRMEEGKEWPCRRHNHAMGSVGERLLLFGGATHGKETAPKHFEQVYCDDVWLYAPSSNTWVQRAMAKPRPCGRHCHTLTDCGGGKFVVFGGFGNGRYQNDVWLLETSEEEDQDWTWSLLRVAGQGPSARSQHAACFHNGRLWIFGGYFWEGRGEVYYNDLFSFSLADLVWTEHRFGGPCPSPRNRCCMVVVAGRVLLINGNFYNNKRGTDKWFAETWELLATDHAWHLAQVESSDYNRPSQSHMCCAVSEDGLWCYFFGGEAKKERFNTLHILVAK